MSTPVVGDVRQEWDWVKVGVQEILDAQPQLTFRPEDVYADCIAGKATLFIDEYQSFAVTTIEVDRFTGQNTFLIWLAWCSRKGLKHNSSMEMYTPFFEQVARDCKCSSLETKTPLNKLNDYYLDNGWNLDTRVFTRKL
tara:strand:- start:56 stop:472 length:417 start_codon:yes stop_codon:yes gene_type:complete